MYPPDDDGGLDPISRKEVSMKPVTKEWRGEIRSVQMVDGPSISEPRVSMAEIHCMEYNPKGRFVIVPLDAEELLPMLGKILRITVTLEVV